MGGHAGQSQSGNAIRFEDYPINISPIPDDEGGGFLVTFPDLPGCIADGDTMDEAIIHYRGQFVLRVPQNLHVQLAERAAAEDVSLNQLAATLLAQGLAGR